MTGGANSRSSPGDYRHRCKQTVRTQKKDQMYEVYDHPKKEDKKMNETDKKTKMNENIDRLKMILTSEQLFFKKA